MAEPDRGNSARQGDVTLGNDPRKQMRAELLALRQRGATYEELAEELGVSKAALHKALNNPDYWSDRVIEGVLKERWVSFTARLRLPVDIDREQVPSSLMAEVELRHCPVTGQFFIPATPHQRFAPGLSEAVKRAARRDLKKAREKYRESGGDWGK